MRSSTNGIDRFAYGAHTDALLVMQRSAEQLIRLGKGLWQPERLTDHLFAGLTDSEILVGYHQATPIAAMLLTHADPEYWPDAPPGSSRFVHKLAVAPAYQGKGIGRRMLDKAVQEARASHATYLRLDCAGDRPRLCHFYEAFGFVKVKEGWVGPYFSACYEAVIGLERSACMETYKNLSGESGVVGYVIEADSIEVAFRDGGRYLYTYASAGETNVEEMKQLALAGQGLNTFINQHVRADYATKLS